MWNVPCIERDCSLCIVSNFNLLTIPLACVIFCNICMLIESGRAASFEDLSDDEDSEKKDFGQHEGSCGGASSQSEGEYETCDSGVSERSSLSDECLERRNSGSKLPRYNT